MIVWEWDDGDGSKYEQKFDTSLALGLPSMALPMPYVSLFSHKMPIILVKYDYIIKK